MVEKALDAIDEKARWLANHPKGPNYDVTTYRMILPAGVTPFVEFIPSRAPRYWIDGWLPRVLTPAELFEAMDKGSLAAAAPAPPNTVRLN